MGEATAHLYLLKDAGRDNPGCKPVEAFKKAQEQAHSGYAGQIQQAFVKGVLVPVGDWRREVSAVIMRCRGGGCYDTG